MEWPHIRGLKDLKVQYELLKQQTKVRKWNSEESIKKAFN
jgi:hypothetical protein